MVYPKKALEKGIEGSILVNFTVCTDGSIRDIAINNQNSRRSADELLEQEDIRLFESMPRWTPGYAHGKPAKTRYIYPVTFRLAKAK